MREVVTVCGPGSPSYLWVILGPVSSTLRASALPAVKGGEEYHSRWTVRRIDEHVQSPYNVPGPEQTLCMCLPCSANLNSLALFQGTGDSRALSRVASPTVPLALVHDPALPHLWLRCTATCRQPKPGLRFNLIRHGGHSVYAFCHLFVWWCLDILMWVKYCTVLF